MSRLVTFGCSHTYGHGLEDCLLEDNRPGREPSKFAWPSLLGEMLDLDVVNMSMPGASNLHILYRMLQFKFQEDDQIVVLWTHTDRDLVFLEKPLYHGGQLILPIGSWGKDQDSINFEAWAQVHSQYDMMIRSLYYIHHAENYLEKLSLKNNHFSADNKLLKFIPNYLKFENTISSFKNLIEKNNLDIDDYCLVGSSPLSVYGLREGEDLDYLHINPFNIKDDKDLIHSHNEYGKNLYDLNYDEIILNPDNHFYSRGVKFASLNVIKNMKQKRNEMKDVIDVNLINSIT